MYESFYQLSSDPFRLLPDPGICYPHRSCARAWAYLRYALKRGEGIVVVTGPPGTGKTTLAERLLNELNPSKVVSVRLIANDLNPTDLLRKLAYSFGLTVEGMDRAMLAHRIERYLIELEHSQRRALVLVDEAQTLSHQSLEALRLLTDLQSRSRAVFQLILLGQEELEGVMSAPGMEQFQQRVIASCRLQRMDLTETKAYMEYRLGYAGWSGDPSINGSAVKAIFDYSRGLPRHVNKICSRLLLHGCTEEKHALNERDVKAVVSDLRDELLAPLTGDVDYQAGGSNGVFDPVHELALVPNSTPVPEPPVLRPEPAADQDGSRRAATSIPGLGSPVNRPPRRSLRPSLLRPYGLRLWLQRRRRAVPEHLGAEQLDTRSAAEATTLGDGAQEAGAGPDGRVRPAGWRAAPHHLATGLAVLSSAVVAVVAVQIGQGLMPPIGQRPIETADTPVLAPSPGPVASGPALETGAAPGDLPGGGDRGETGVPMLDAVVDPAEPGWASLADAAEGVATEALAVADPASAPVLDALRLVGIATVSGAPDQLLSSTLDGIVIGAVVDHAAAVRGGTELRALALESDAAVSRPAGNGVPSGSAEAGPEGVVSEGQVNSVTLAQDDPGTPPAAADPDADAGPLAEDLATGDQLPSDLILVVEQAPALDLVSYSPSPGAEGTTPRRDTARQSAEVQLPVVAVPMSVEVGQLEQASPEPALEAAPEDRRDGVVQGDTAATDGPSQVAASTPSEGVPTAGNPQVQQLLIQADEAMADNRLLLPEQRSAHHYLRRALEIDPGNAEAQAGVQNIVRRYGELARDALTDGDTGKAEVYIRRGLRVDPANAEIRAVHADVKQTLAAAELAAIRAAEIELMAAEFEAPEPVLQRAPEPQPKPKPPNNFESLMSVVNGL